MQPVRNESESWLPLKRRDSIGNLKRKLKHLDAVILTGNYRHIEDEKKRKEILVSYAETVKIILEHAIKRNEDGWGFPVYAFDFGFEALVYHLFEDKVSFKPVIFENKMRDLKLTRNRHRWKELRTFVYRYHNDSCEYERIYYFDKKTALLNDELKACKE